MFIRIYKTGYIFHAFSLVIIAVVIWLPSFFVHQTKVEDGSLSLVSQLLNEILGQNNYAGLLASFFLTMLGGLIINSLIIANEISGKTSMLGFFFFVLLNTSIGPGLILNQFFVSSFFILLMVNTLFKIPKAEDTIPITFNASLFLGLAGLFYYPSILLIIVIWVALMIFSVSSWREYVVAIIGVSIPLFFAFFWFYFNDGSDAFYANFINAFHFDLSFWSMPFMDSIIAILLLGIIVPSLIKLSGSLMEKGIVLRQKLTFTIWLFVILVLLILFFEKHMDSGILLAVPGTIILTNVTAEVKKVRWLDLYISLVFVLVLLNHYLIFF